MNFSLNLPKKFALTLSHENWVDFCDSIIGGPRDLLVRSRVGLFYTTIADGRERRADVYTLYFKSEVDMIYFKMEYL